MGASKLTLERLRKGYSQILFSNLTGVNRCALSAIERRRITATKKNRQAIVSVIGGNEADFFDQETGLAI